MEKKRLQLIFKNLDDKKITISIDEPKEDLTTMDIKSCMDTIVEKNIFDYPSGGLVETVGARIVTTTVEEMEI